MEDERHPRSSARSADELTGSLVTATRARPVRAEIVLAAARVPRLFASAVNELSR